MVLGLPGNRQGRVRRLRGMVLGLPGNRQGRRETVNTALPTSSATIRRQGGRMDTRGGPTANIGVTCTSAGGPVPGVELFTARTWNV